MDKKMFVWPKRNIKKCDIPPTIVKLRHPRTGTSSVFLHSQSSELQEILNFKDGHRSWFFTNHVVSNKVNLNIFTPIDKILLLLPYLEKSKNFSPLLDIVVDEDFPSNQLIFDENMDISCITDKKCVAGLDVYRLSKRKAIKYLLQKVEQVSLVLKERQIDVSMGNFSASCRDLRETVNDSDYKRFACGILSEYISNDLAQELLKECQLNNQEKSSTPIKRSPEQTECEPDLKRKKTESTNEPVEDYSKIISTSKTHARIPTVKLSNSQKKLMNASEKGMQKIQSFFGKPK